MESETKTHSLTHNPPLKFSVLPALPSHGPLNLSSSTTSPPSTNTISVTTTWNESPPSPLRPHWLFLPSPPASPLASTLHKGERWGQVGSSLPQESWRTITLKNWYWFTALLKVRELFLPWNELPSSAAYPSVKYDFSASKENSFLLSLPKCSVNHCPTLHIFCNFNSLPLPIFFDLPSVKSYSF